MVYLALAHQDRRVRGPSPISPTHRGHSSLWQKSWLTLVDYLWIHCGVGNWCRIHTTGKCGSSTAHWKSKCVYTITIHTTSYHIPLHVHTRPAGSGVHLPSAPHTAVTLPTGTNIGLHPISISAPSVVFWYGSIEPFVGKVGSLQLTGRRKEWSMLI